MLRKRTGRKWCNFPDCSVQRHSLTSLETARSLANGSSWGVGGWGRSIYSAFCSLYLVLWFCAANIKVGTKVISDCWKYYGGIGDLEVFYFEQITLNRSENFVESATDTPAQTIEFLWLSSKKHNQRQCGTPIDKIDDWWAPLWIYVASAKRKQKSLSFVNKFHFFNFTIKVIKIFRFHYYI